MGSVGSGIRGLWRPQGLQSRHLHGRSPFQILAGIFGLCKQDALALASAFVMCKIPQGLAEIVEIEVGNVPRARRQNLYWESIWRIMRLAHSQNTR